MAALDFPTSPSIGQKYPASPVAGIPTYTWDGEKWTTIGGATSGGMAVLYDTAQTLTAAQQQQARRNIYAAPFDALAYSGLQINGAMEVSQENGATAVAPPQATLKYIVDNWPMYYNSATAAMQGGQSSPSGVAGLSSCIYLRANTGAPFSGASDFATIQQSIEGYRIASLGWGTAGASPITVAFWIQASITGTFALAIQNSTTNRSYIADVVINAANTWEYKTVTIPGCVDGTWNNNNTVGMVLEFNFSVGSGLRAPANAWQAANYRGSVATTNFFGVNNQQVALTGVVVLPGNEAPSATRSPYIMRPYDQELMTCRRYWQTNNFVLSGYNVAGGAIYGSFLFSPMRAAPTVTLPGWSSSNAGGIVAGSITNGSITMQATATATGAAYAAGGIVCDARL